MKEKAAIVFSGELLKSRSCGILLLIACWLLSSCSFAQTSGETELEDRLKTLLAHTVEELNPSELHGKRGEFVFLDARAVKEYQVSHLPNAIWVGYADFSSQRVSRIPKSSKIVVYCTVGYRSEKVGEKLLKMGYEQVYNLYGGIFSWKDSGFELVDSQGTATERVHTYNKKWSRWLKTGIKVTE